MKLKTVLPVVCLASMYLVSGCFLASDSVTPSSGTTVRGAVSADSVAEEAEVGAGDAREVGAAEEEPAADASEEAVTAEVGERDAAAAGDVALEPAGPTADVPAVTDAPTATDAPTGPGVPAVADASTGTDAPEGTDASTATDTNTASSASATTDAGESKGPGTLTANAAGAELQTPAEAAGAGGAESTDAAGESVGAAGADSAVPIGESIDGSRPMRAPILATDSLLALDGEEWIRGMVLVPGASDIVVPQVLTVDLQLLTLQLLGAVNEARRRAGVPMLGLDPTLLAASRRYSAELAVRGEISHDSPRPGGRTFRQRFAAAGGRARLVGENLARVTASPESLAEIVTQAWMRSPGHRRNLLDRQFTRTGIGVSLGPDGVWYVAQMYATPR